MATQQFLSDFLRRVYADFERSEWCDTNSFQFNSGTYPLAVNQQRYLLKYFAAYFCEYYFAYTDLFGRVALPRARPLNVLSVGCGCGTDFYALQRLIADQDSDLRVSYTGVDVVHWGYQPNTAGFQFIQTSLADLPDPIVHDIDVVVFPKSLTELPTSDLARFGNQLATHNGSERLYFLNSYITENSVDPQSIKGIGNFAAVDTALRNGKRASVDDIHRYFHHTKHDSGLRANFPFFVFPDDVIASVQSLKSRCPNRHPAHSACSACNIDFWPILNSRYIAFNILEYTGGRN